MYKRKQDKVDISQKSLSWDPDDIRDIIYASSMLNPQLLKVFSLMLLIYKYANNCNSVTTLRTLPYTAQIHEPYPC